MDKTKETDEIIFREMQRSNEQFFRKIIQHNEVNNDISNNSNNFNNDFNNNFNNNPF